MWTTSKRLKMTSVGKDMAIKESDTECLRRNITGSYFIVFTVQIAGHKSF